MSNRGVMGNQLVHCGLIVGSAVVAMVVLDVRPVAALMGEPAPMLLVFIGKFLGATLLLGLPFGLLTIEIGLIVLLNLRVGGLNVALINMAAMGMLNNASIFELPLALLLPCLVGVFVFSWGLNVLHRVFMMDRHGMVTMHISLVVFPVLTRV